ncbi:MAG: hypothetical protein ACXAC2_07120, partial [Candidatus Kariarchaeaceae archaeon]
GLTPGEHTIHVRVTNTANVTRLKEIVIIVPGPTTSEPPTTMSSTTSIISSQETKTEKVDRGIFSNPAVAGVLVFVMLISILSPWVLMRRS